MSKSTTPSATKPATTIAIADLFPGELFRFENDTRLLRLVRVEAPERERTESVCVTIGNLGNSQGDRCAMFLASTRVIPAGL